MAVAAPTAHATHRTTDLNLRGTFTFFQEDRDRSGRYTEGDRLDFEFDLWEIGRGAERHKGSFFGDGDGECIVTEVVFGEAFASKCAVEFDSLDGRLYMEGEISRRAFEGRQAFNLKVVEGSRHFADSHGEATFFAEDEWRGGAGDPRDCRRHDGRHRRDRCRGHHHVFEDFAVFVHFDR